MIKNIKKAFYISTILYVVSLLFDYLRLLGIIFKEETTKVYTTIWGLTLDNVVTDSGMETTFSLGFIKIIFFYLVYFVIVLLIVLLIQAVRKGEKREAVL